MDIQNVDDKQFTVTLNAFFVLRWTDRRIAIRQDEFKKLLTKGEKTFFLLLHHLLNFLRQYSMNRKDLKTFYENKKVLSVFA